MNEFKENCYMILGLRHYHREDKDFYIVTTSKFYNDGCPVEVCVSPKYFEKCKFVVGQLVSLAWNRDKKKFDGVFPIVFGDE